MPEPPDNPKKAPVQEVVDDEPRVPTEEFWNGFLRAAETEPHGSQKIPGASGMEHLAKAIGLDEARSRLVVVSEGM